MTLIAWMVVAAGSAMMPAQAVEERRGKEVRVRVDARAAPWSTGANPKKAFGLADARPPVVVWGLGKLIPGVKLRFAATGTTVTEIGSGQSFGPDGQGDWTSDRGMAFFPSHHMRAKRPIHLNELVGCFVDGDGTIVGQPFPIGSRAEVEIPEGAAAVSLGINDDRYSDNGGFLNVVVTMPEPEVIVEPNNTGN